MLFRSIGGYGCDGVSAGSRGTILIFVGGSGNGLGKDAVDVVLDVLDAEILRRYGYREGCGRVDGSRSRVGAEGNGHVFVEVDVLPMG